MSTMNRYAKKFRALRKVDSPLVRLRFALLYASIGFALHWAISWRPVVRRDPPRMAIAPDSRAALADHRILLVNRLTSPAGRPDNGPAAWLRAQLEASGARILEPGGSADTSAEVCLELAGNSGDEAASTLAFRHPADSLSARLAQDLSAGVAAALGLPVSHPEIVSRLHAPEGTRAEASVLILWPQHGPLAESPAWAAQGLAQALAQHLAAGHAGTVQGAPPPPAGAASRP